MGCVPRFEKDSRDLAKCIASFATPAAEPVAGTTNAIERLHEAAEPSRAGLDP